MDKRAFAAELRRLGGAVAAAADCRRLHRSRRLQRSSRACRRIRFRADVGAATWPSSVRVPATVLSMIGGGGGSLLKAWTRGGVLARARRGRHQAHVARLPLVRLSRVCALRVFGGDTSPVAAGSVMIKEFFADGMMDVPMDARPPSPRRSSRPSRNMAARS